jgi:hypothetical protein
MFRKLDNFKNLFFMWRIVFVLLFISGSICAQETINYARAKVISGVENGIGLKDAVNVGQLLLATSVGTNHVAVGNATGTGITSNAGFTFTNNNRVSLPFSNGSELVFGNANHFIKRDNTNSIEIQTGASPNGLFNVRELYSQQYYFRVLEGNGEVLFPKKKIVFGNTLDPLIDTQMYSNSEAFNATNYKLLHIRFGTPTSSERQGVVIGDTYNQQGGLYFGNPNHGIQRNIFGNVNNLALYNNGGNLYLASNTFNTAIGSSQFVFFNSGRISIGQGTENTNALLTINGKVALPIYSSPAAVPISEVAGAGFDANGILGTTAISLKNVATTANLTGAGTTATPLDLAPTGITAGTYNSLTVDAKGRATAGTNTPYLPLTSSTDQTLNYGSNVLNINGQLNLVNLTTKLVANAGEGEYGYDDGAGVRNGLVFSDGQVHIRSTNGSNWSGVGVLNNGLPNVYYPGSTTANEGDALVLTNPASGEIKFGKTKKKIAYPPITSTITLTDEDVVIFHGANGNFNFGSTIYNLPNTPNFCGRTVSFINDWGYNNSSSYMKANSTLSNIENVAGGGFTNSLSINFKAKLVCTCASGGVYWMQE